MPKSVAHPRMDFYLESLDKLILSRDGITVSPREGETIALGKDCYKVCSVSHNLDYMDSGWEVWRTNVMLAPLKEATEDV